MATFLRLRQVCLVAHDLDKAAADITETLGLRICHRDPNVGRYGLRNFLVPIGSNFLEVVAPLKSGNETAAGRYLQRRNGDGGYMVILDCDDVGPWRTHMGRVDVRVVEDRAYTDKAHLMQLHPRDTGACILEIDHHVGGRDPLGAYQWAGDHWQQYIRTDRTQAIRAVELQADNPLALADRWGQILKRKVGSSGTQSTLALDNAEIRYAEARDGRGEGLGGVELAVTDKAAILRTAAARELAIDGNVVTICGTRFSLSAPA